jgi:hypothetical protein
MMARIGKLLLLVCLAEIMCSAYNGKSNLALQVELPTIAAPHPRVIRCCFALFIESKRRCVLLCAAGKRFFALA